MKPFRLAAVVLAVMLGLIPLQGAGRFDGSNDLLQWDDAPAGLNFTNELTVSFWLYKEAGLANGASFVGKGRVKNGQAHHWSVENSSAAFLFNFANPNNTFHTFNTSATYPSTNVWMHVAFRIKWYDRTTAQFFVNGTNVTTSIGANPADTVALTNNEPFRIATLYTGSSARCRMQEVAVWNGYLTAQDIYALAASRTTGAPLRIGRPMLRGYWPLRREFANDATASGTNTVKDVSGYGQHLTPLNSPTYTPGHLASP